VNAVWIDRVPLECFQEHFSSEDIDSHVGKHSPGLPWKGPGVKWFFFETGDALRGIHFKNSKLTRPVTGINDRRHCYVRVAFPVTLEQYSIIHVVNVVRG